MSRDRFPPRALRGAALACAVPILLSACATGASEQGEAAAPDAPPAPDAVAAPATAAESATERAQPHAAAAHVRTALHDPRETHLRNVTQLTFGGQNAEAYFSFDGRRLVFQSTPQDEGCDQIYSMTLEGEDVQLISTGTGRTTCAYYYPSGREIVYSSTHHYDDACPAPPDYSLGYVWPIYPSFDVFVVDTAGGEPRQLTHEFGYDAEATFSLVGDRMVFTSMRDGDLELYTMRADGSDVRRLTHEPGYDGGAFFSPDGSRIVWRAHHPATEQELMDYRTLLARGLIRPGALDIWVMNADGTGRVRLTDNGAANFAPYWHPSGEWVAFSSNMGDPRGREFDLYRIRVDGTGLEQLTWTPEFDGFPVFSPDGRYLVFASNRHGSVRGETNIFRAEWIENP
jgi:Tol biopolymer transport system component